MRHIHYLNGTRKVYDGQFLCLLVVVGQRDEAFFRAQVPPPSREDRVQHDKFRAGAAIHTRRQTSGYFSETTLEWCETPEEAAEVMAKFIAPEWINVRIEKVDTVT